LTEENGEAVSLTNGESRLIEEEEDVNTSDTDDNTETRALVSEGEMQKVSGTCLHYNALDTICWTVDWGLLCIIAGCIWTLVI